MKLEYVEDAPRSGRPAKVTSEIEDAIVESFVGDRGGSNKPVRTVKVAEDLGVSATTVLRVLDKRKVAFDRKSGHSHWDGTWKVMPDKKSTAKAKAKTKQDTG